MRRCFVWIAVGIAPAMACVGDDPAGNPTPADDGGTQNVSDAASSSSSGGNSEQDADVSSEAGVRCDATQPFERVRPFFRVNTTADELDLRFSVDGQLAYFSRRAGKGSMDVFVASRAVNFEDSAALTSVNSTDTGVDDGAPTVTPDGLEILFHSNEGVQPNGIRVWHATRPNTLESFSDRKPLAALATFRYGSPIFVASGDAAYLTHVEGGVNSIERIARTSPGVYQKTVTMMAAGEHPAVTNDELTMYFSRRTGNADVLWVATRGALDGQFGPPQRVILPGPAKDMSARPTWVSASGCTLVFVGPKPNGQDAGPADSGPFDALDAASPRDDVDYDIFIASKGVDELP